VICRHFGPCGGCQLQDVPYAEQLAGKQRRLEQLLRDAIGDAVPPVRPVIGMSLAADERPWHFRHKAAFVFAPAPDRHGGFVMGHYAAGSQTVIPVDECPVHSARANRLAFTLRDRLAAARIPAAGPRLRGILRYVVIRTTADDREAVVMLVVTRNDRTLRAPLKAFAASADAPDGLLVNVHDRPGPYMIGRTTIRIAGREAVRESSLPLAFLASPSSFFQTNPEAARVLLDEALSQVRPLEPADRPLRLMDLYAGSGLFALPFAARGHDVTAVEENPESVETGRANARLNRIPPARITWVRDAVEQFLRRRGVDRPDIVLMDPPRQGCGPTVLDGVFRDIRPRLAIYVSCAPDALARDLKTIREAGYRITRAQPVDMFPHTTHIETVVTLSVDGEMA
jgi:23S rRNA (uracil1939-C5)-methyltransferase